MPGRNVIKEYVGESYYHIYNRGVNKNNIFLDRQDRLYFLSLINRYLGDDVQKKPHREIYPNYANDLELLAYCLMNNHFHLFIFQQPASAITEVMSSLTIAYSMYFNKKYKRVGAVFQQRYRGVRIIHDSQFLHITRYIHMNPKRYTTYEWPSLPNYLGYKQDSWLRPVRVLTMLEGNYIKFLKEYDDKRAELAALKHQLANS
jgi:putative transposase